MPYANVTNTKPSQDEYIKPKELKCISFFTKGCNLQKCINVPIRQNGMTSSGKQLDCHSNVSKLVYTYGGSEIRGYYVTTKTEDGLTAFCFNPHSVWKTPEGILVDVTPDGVGSKEISFIPFAENNPTKNFYSTSTQIFVSADGDLFIDDPGTGSVKIKLSKSQMKRGGFPIEQLWGLIDKPYLVQHKDKLEYSSFSKPSTATGKYFELRTLPNDTESKLL